jgi:hypothetical protein
MFSPFLKRVYLFTLIMTILSIIIFTISGSNIEIKETIFSIIGVYLKIVLPLLIVYKIWKWIRDGIIGKEKIIVMLVNSIIYTLLCINLIVIIFYIISLVKKQ